MLQRGWYYYDFLVITGDAYVDHPSFGTAIISRVLEAEGYRVAILAQPNWRELSSFTDMGRPRYGVFINGGNIDSMVAHYTAARKRRHDDAYSPGNRAGLRPDRATGRPLGTSPLSSEGWRPPCAGSPTTITGRTRSGAPSSWTPRPTCSPMAWGSGPPGSWPLSWPPAHRQQRSLR